MMELHNMRHSMAQMFFPDAHQVSQQSLPRSLRHVAVNVIRFVSSESWDDALPSRSLQSDDLLEENGGGEAQGGSLVESSLHRTEIRQPQKSSNF